jgi:hypothetical protein
MTPEALTALRDRILAAGLPADDLPDRLVPGVAALVDDRDRLDWLRRRRAEVVRAGGRWEVRYGSFRGEARAVRSDDLRAAIRLAMVEARPEEDRQDAQIALMRAAADCRRAVDPAGSMDEGPAGGPETPDHRNPEGWDGS